MLLDSARQGGLQARGGCVTLPRVLVELVKRYEGLHKQVRRQGRIEVVPYLCPAGYWTIGYGRLCAENDPPITAEIAEQYLQEDLATHFAHAMRLSPILLREDEDRQSAITSFIFNLGPGRYQQSTLRRRVNEGSWAEAAQEIRRWVYGGGKKLPGLVARREVEALLIEGAMT